MKSMKKSVIKRIVIYFCCTIISISSIFMSYETTAYASSVSDDLDSQYEKIIDDALITTATALGLWLSGGTAATLMPVVLSGALQQSGNLKDYVNTYLYSNEDGTTTISEDFINLVLRSYKEYVGGSFSGNLEQNENLYYVYGESEFVVDWLGQGKYVSISEGFTYAYPVAFLYADNNNLYRYNYWGTPTFDIFTCNGVSLIAFFYNGNPDSANGGINLVNKYISLVGNPRPDPFVKIYKDGEFDHSSRELSFYGISGNMTGISSSVSSSSIPIYTNFDLMVSDLQSGKYTHADNLSSGVNFGQTSSYTGTYGGGDIKITTEKLNGIQDKLNEINAADKDIDAKLGDLLAWLELNNGSGTGGGGTGGTGSGTVDMSTANSWLAKIYAKVCEIFDKMTQKDSPDLDPDQDKDSVSDNSIDLSPTNTILEGIRADINAFMEKLIPGNSQDQDKDSISGNSVSGNSVSGNSIDLSHTNSILDSIKAGLDDIHETLKKIKRWTVVDTIVDGADAIADWFDMIHDLISDADSGAESVVSTLSSALGDSLGLMKTKFPFSIPWDILFFVTSLSAEPEVPQFSIPFDFEISALDLEVHYDLELDFTPFQWLSDLSRLILSMTYAVGLMKLTFNVSTVEKEG